MLSQKQSADCIGYKNVLLYFLPSVNKINNTEAENSSWYFEDVLMMFQEVLWGWNLQILDQFLKCQMHFLLQKLVIIDQEQFL